MNRGYCTVGMGVNRLTKNANINRKL